MKQCEMCQNEPATNSIKAQTIPGSFDTKFAELRMCGKCANEYRAFIADIWQPVFDAAPANPHDDDGPGHPCGPSLEQEQAEYDATVAHMGREW